MTKRRINHQQTTRIETKQRRYRERFTPTEPSQVANGRVIKRFNRRILIEDEQGKRVHCSIRPSLDMKQSDGLVAGDRVIWQMEGLEQGVVVSRYPRTTVFSRPDQHGQLKPIAANVTQIMIVIAPKPAVSWPLLDSYLVLAESLQITPCIVLNKTDLASNELRTALSLYEQTLEYTVITTGYEQPNGYQALQQALMHQISVFVGQSGVGKSSLIAQILPDKSADIAIGPISDISELGRHTTSNACWYALAGQGALIDSPGVREVGLWHMPADDIAAGYREFRPFLSHCKFRNCNHQNTPGCALLDAVKNKQISRTRYENYVKISALLATRK